MAGVPMAKITGWTFALVALFVLAGVVLALAGQPEMAQGALGTATGIVVGSGVATTIVVKAGNSAEPETSSEPPAAPKAA